MEPFDMSLDNPPNQSSQPWEGQPFDGSPIQSNRGEHFWTFDAVEERLIEAMRLWWRSPGGGKWPFAADAPWHLMTRKTRIEAGEFKGREMQLRMQAEDAEEAKRWEGRERSGPLTRDDVARRDEATEWLGMVPGRDRRLVILVLLQRASGRTNVDWARVKLQLSAEIERKGLYRRYSRAISGVVKRLNGEAPAAMGSENGGFASGVAVKMRGGEACK
jgi:hypothetical protein